MSFAPEDIIQDFREDVNDLKTPYLWSDAQCVRFFNRAREEMVRRIPIVDNSTDDDDDGVPLTEIDIVADTRDYTYSPLIQAIDKVVVSSTGYELDKWSPDSLSEYNRNWRQMSGQPDIYVEGLAGPNSISFIPTPSATDIVYMSIRRQVLTSVTVATWATEISEPDDEWQEALIQGMKMYAYLRRDADAGSVELQRQAAAVFDSIVGKPLTAEQVMDRRLSANARLHYRPAASFWRREPRYFNRRYRPDRYW